MVYRGAVIGVAAVAAVAFYEHGYALVQAHGEAGWTARLVQFTVDGLTYASSIVTHDMTRRQVAGPCSGSMAARRGHRGDPGGEHAHGLGHGVAGAAVAAWPAVALVGSYELLMIIRGVQVPADVTTGAWLSGRLPDADPLQMQAEDLFADDLAAGRVPSVRVIRTRLHVGQSRAQWAQAHLASLAPHSRLERRSNVHRHVASENDRIVHHGICSVSGDHTRKIR